MRRNRICWVALVLAVTIQPVWAFYNTQTGRWLNRDPIREEGFERVGKRSQERDAGESSLHAFAVNNPIGRVDFFGLKAEPPGPAGHCQDPCRWAREHNDDNAYGVTVCCNGKKYACVLKPGNHATDPIAKSIITTCIQAHEDSHATDSKVVCRPRCWWTGPVPATTDTFEDQFNSECAGYNEEVKCLTGRKSECNGNTVCETQVEAQIANAQKQADYYCRLSKYPMK